MDEVDLQILRKLYWQPHDPVDAARGIMGPWDIARELRVHGNTVKRRLQAMHEARVLDGIELTPEPGLVGLHAEFVRFAFEDPAAKVVGSTRLVERRFDGEGPGTLAVWTFVGTETWAGVMVPEPMELDAAIDELAEQAGAVETERLGSMGWETDPIELSELDRRILSVLHEDALQPSSVVAARSGVTERTVRRRLGRMAKAKVFALYPMARFEKFEGQIPVLIAIRPRAPDAQIGHAFFNAFPEACLRGHPDHKRPFVVLGAASTEQIDEATRRAQRVDGVGRADAMLFQDSTPCPVLGPHVKPPWHILGAAAK